VVQEAEAARTIAQRGVVLVGTAHGIELGGLLKNPDLVRLVGGVMPVTLGDAQAAASNQGKKVRRLHCLLRDHVDLGIHAVACMLNAYSPGIECDWHYVQGVAVWASMHSCVKACTAMPKPSMRRCHLTCVCCCCCHVLAAQVRLERAGAATFTSLVELQGKNRWGRAAYSTCSACSSQCDIVWVSLLTVKLLAHYAA
jgi:hypothetical protein